VDDRQPQHSLADDPIFLADLDALDHDLTAVAKRPGGHKRDGLTAPPAAAAAQPTVRARGTVEPHVETASAALPGGGVSRRRPLLDLFPPAPDRPTSQVASGPQGVAKPLQATAAASGSPAYETFYGLHEKPFGLIADPRFLYRSTSHDRVGQELLSAIRRRDGLVVLTGDIGTGKTITCRAVVEQLDRRTLTSFVADPFVTVEDLLKTILVDFGVISSSDSSAGQYSGASRSELSTALREFLASLAALQAFAVVIIDEAQNLTVDLLEQLPVLLDLENAERLLQVVLVGQPNLVAKLRRSELRRLNRRVSVRCQLEPLGGDEILGYVQQRLTVAGSDGRVAFDDGALARLFDLSGGVPRVINLLCDRALTRACEASVGSIDENLIEAAADDLDLKPFQSQAARLARAGLAGAALALLMLLGAAASAFVFHDRLAVAAARWESIPALPASPAPRLPGPLAPLPPPPEPVPPRS
jgi:general secretion pathway protein A